ncbi:hypothetical protein OG234_13155 [Streptomyces sp. NBC_01420]|uniref:hypothetical protein n=1 Tax=Streptomyces sp. NBC_01420 TaxID=2903858 RepID=UPI00324755A2
MPLQTTACEPWPIMPCCEVPDDEGLVEHWQRVATEILWRLSGRRIGLCPVTVRPCRRTCLDAAPISFQAGAGTGPWVPYIGTDGGWRNASVCGCRPSGCGCSELCEVKLEGPVHSVTRVNVDGVDLIPEAYRVDAPGLLVRTDGECWPDCQELADPEGAPGTFTVTYLWGIAPDASATAAVSELFCHLLKGCGGAGGGACGCKANPRITRLQRQGVEIEMPDPTLSYSEGLTGLPLVDLWLAATNPDRLSRPSRVYSVDYARPRKTTWP